MADKWSSEWFDVSKRYYDTFGDGFLAEMYAGSESDMIALMRECIASGKPYAPSLFDEDGWQIVY